MPIPPWPLNPRTTVTAIGTFSVPCSVKPWDAQEHRQTPTLTTTVQEQSQGPRLPTQTLVAISKNEVGRISYSQTQQPPPKARPLHPCVLRNSTETRALSSHPSPEDSW